MDPSYPKILILIQPFNDITGGGITLSNLFRGWPKDRIAVVGLGNLIDNKTKIDICETYYRLGREEVKWIFPFNKIKRKIKSGLIKFDITGNSNAIPKKSAFRSNFAINYIDPFLIWTGLYEFLYRIEISNSLKAWITSFEPEVIYSQAHTRGRVLFCTQVQQHLGIPMVFHMMDDWIPLVRKQSLLGKYWYRRSDADFRVMLSKSALHLGISDGMAIEYKRRYGYDFKTFHNPVQIDFWEKGQRDDYRLSTNPTILYAGRVGLGIEDSLRLMAKAVQLINSKTNGNIRFVLQTSKAPDWINKFSCVEHRSFVPYEQLPISFGEADLLFLPYDFSEESIDFIKLSMPTKASEFMASGTPILIFAPADTALVEYAKEYGWAKIITNNKVEFLVQGLEEVLANTDLRKDIGTRAVSVACERHEAFLVRKEFKNSLISVLNTRL